MKISPPPISDPLFGTPESVLRSTAWVRFFQQVATQFDSLPAYANNAAAKAGGLVAGNIYRTGGNPDLICVVH